MKDKMNSALELGQLDQFASNPGQPSVGGRVLAVARAKRSAYLPGTWGASGAVDARKIAIVQPPARKGNSLFTANDTLSTDKGSINFHSRRLRLLTVSMLAISALLSGVLILLLSSQ